MLVLASLQGGEAILVFAIDGLVTTIDFISLSFA